MSPEIRDVPSVITLDGPAGVGKSTTARRLAAALQRRGFSWQDIRPALSRLGEELPED